MKNFLTYRLSFNAWTCFAYVIIAAILLKSGNTISTLGDYRVYRVAVYSFNPLEFSPEVFTQFIFSYINILWDQVVTGLILLFSIVIWIEKERKIKIQDIFIFIAIFNPFVLQFFFFESKEFLMCVAIFFYIRIRIPSKKNQALLLTLVALIRPMAVILLIPLLIERVAKGRRILFGYFIPWLFAFTFLSIYFSIDFNQYYESYIRHLSNAFLGYSGASTNRYEINVPVRLFSQETLVILYTGLYTVFFPIISSSIFSSFLIMVTGFFKAYLFIKVYLRERYKWIIVASLFGYAVPLSIYNIGSSLRYSIPFFFMLYILYYLRRKSDN